ncbi:Fc.00g000060.m01.CDS01 [Cosmosporella sp. VM-42]
MTPTTTLDASRQKQQQAHPPSPSLVETSSPREDKDNGPSTSGVGASNEPIWIPSDVDSDAEDDGDDGQDFDGSRSDATLPSINSLAAQSQPRNPIHADSPSNVFDDIDAVLYVDLTTACAIESDAMTSVVSGTPRSSPHTAVNPPTPAQTSQTPDLEHFSSDQAPCQGRDAPASGTLACHDGIPETPYEYPQRHLSQDTSEGQGLATAERSTVTGDATHVATPIPSSRSTPDPPTPACASQPPTLTPLDMDDAPCRGDDVSVSATPSRQNSIPGAGDVSPKRQPSFETPQGQVHETSDRGSEDVEAHELSEGAPQSSSGARASPSRPLGPITRRRARHQAVHRLVQDDDDSSSDTSNESQGSEYHLDRANLRRDKDYYPSHTEAEEVGLEGDKSDGEDQCPRKRRKVSRFSAGVLRNAAASVERSRRGRPSLRSWGKNTQASGILSPVSSQATSDETQVTAVLASFEEWPLENASLKRITENGKTTFQLQFNWTPCTKHGHASSAVQDRVGLPSTRTRSRAKRASAPRAKYTPQEDDLLIELKEGREMLAWPEIHQRFCEAYPGRSVESLQVHYSTKVKRRKRS